MYAKQMVFPECATTIVDTLVNKVTFENSYIDGHTYWQDVCLDGVCIGAIAQKEGSLLKPIKTWYQRCVKKTEAPNLVSWYPTEDAGDIFATFTELSELVIYHLNRG